MDNEKSSTNNDDTSKRECSMICVQKANDKTKSALKALSIGGIESSGIFLLSSKNYIAKKK